MSWRQEASMTFWKSSTNWYMKEEEMKNWGRLTFQSLQDRSIVIMRREDKSKFRSWRSTSRPLRRYSHKEVNPKWKLEEVCLNAKWWMKVKSRQDLEMLSSGNFQRNARMRLRSIVRSTLKWLQDNQTPSLKSTLRQRVPSKLPLQLETQSTTLMALVIQRAKCTWRLLRRFLTWIRTQFRMKTFQQNILVQHNTWVLLQKINVLHQTKSNVIWKCTSIESISKNKLKRRWPRHKRDMKNHSLKRTKTIRKTRSMKIDSWRRRGRNINSHWTGRSSMIETSWRREK